MVLLAALRVRLVPPRSGHSEKLNAPAQRRRRAEIICAQHARGRRPPRGRSPPTGVERLASSGDWRTATPRRRSTHTRRESAEREREHEHTHTNPRVPRAVKTTTMKLAVALACLPAAAALVAPAAPAAGVQMSETKADLEALAKQCNPAVGFWDPLGCLNFDFWKLGQEGTIGYLRHAEIKHGRVAMAGFLGYWAQSTDFISGPHNNLPYRGYEPGLTPPEQWDAIPLIGKVQIITFVGMLESYGELLPQHYTKGGVPGYYPPIKGARPEILLNLWDPFNFMARMTPEAKKAGLVKEINNGRLAMLGIFSLISEARVPGSVPVFAERDPRVHGQRHDPVLGRLLALQLGSHANTCGPPVGVRAQGRRAPPFRFAV